MKVLKQYEYHVINNDIYVLEYMHDHIIINDNYAGLLILDKNLKVTNTQTFHEYFSIYRIYTSCNKKQLLVYNADDTNFLIISLDTQIIKKVLATDTDIIFSPTYYWDNQLILTASPNKFYTLASNQSTIFECSLLCIQESYSKFYNFWEITKKHPVLYDINSCNRTFIFEDETRDEIVFFSQANNKKHTIKKPKEIAYHDIIFSNGIFAFVAEKELLIIKEHLSIRILPEDNYYFLRARFALEHDQIIIFVLSSNGKDCNISTITKYQIINNH